MKYLFIQIKSRADEKTLLDKGCIRDAQNTPNLSAPPHSDAD